jgi:RNA polymerase sigma-70 factor (ECF subfamily)
MVLASRELDSVLGARVSASDVVQQTFLEAYRDFKTLTGKNEGQFCVWLRQVLKNNVAHVVQTHVVAQKRTVDKERPINAGDEDAHDCVEIVDSRQSSPSRRAMRGESAILLAQAMSTLPPHQFEAIRLRYLECMTLAEIAARLERSEVAVAGLLKRGLEGLRKCCAP